MILVIGNIGDQPAAYVCSRMLDRDVDFILFDSRQYPQDCDLTWGVEKGEVTGVIRQGSKLIDLAQIRSVYLRNLGTLPKPGEGISPAEAQRSARNLAILGERSSPAVRTIREFILQNQCNDGSFGFLGQEIFEAQTKGANFPGLKLQVPFALESLWTLAETAARPYSLRHQIGANPSPVPSDSNQIGATPRQ